MNWIKLNENQSEKKIMKESSITRLMRNNDEHDCICLTAYRQDREKDEKGLHKRKAKMSNQTANHALGAALRQLGFNITKVIGQYPETTEDENGKIVPTGATTKESSWFVVNVNDEPDFMDVCAGLAEKDNQDSILFLPKGSMSSGKGCFLYGTKNVEGAWPEYHSRIMTDGISINGDNEYSTRIAGKEFAFNLVDESEDVNFLRSSSMFGSQARISYLKNHYGIRI